MLGAARGGSGSVAPHWWLILSALVHARKPPGAPDWLTSMPAQKARQRHLETFHLHVAVSDADLRTMTLIPRAGTLAPLRIAAAPRLSSTRPCVTTARAISTTCAARAENSSWLRKKLWKGKAPGTADPYTEAAPPESTFNLPDEAVESLESPVPHQTAPAAPARRLVLPPKRTEAMTEKEVQTTDPMYVPTAEMYGLEEIPALKKWWDQPGHWGEESKFRGFGCETRATAHEVVEVYLRQAVTEILVLKRMGKLSRWATKRWKRGDREALDQALAVEICVEAGEVTLKGKARPPRQSFREAESPAPESVSASEAAQMVQAWDPAWKHIVLDDTFKFVVSRHSSPVPRRTRAALTRGRQLRKRLYQLTGIHVPDCRLGAAATVDNVLAFATQASRPPTLAEHLGERGELQQLANVKVHSRRVGPIDKERAIGRWKVIEEELRKRDLPVRLPAGLSGNKEIARVSGKI